jgi:hypothetical protein
MRIETNYNIGQIVFLATDNDQKARIITGIIIRPSGHIYYLSCGDVENSHYEIEFALEKNYQIV